MVLALLGILVAGGYWTLDRGLRARVPSPTPKRVRVKLTATTPLSKAIDQLGDEIIANRMGLKLYCMIRRPRSVVPPGTYSFRTGMTGSQVLAAFQNRVTIDLLLPSGFWTARTAERLEERGVCSAQEYIELARQPDQFKLSESEKLAAGPTLEGLLTPGKYTFEPEEDARSVIEQQLARYRETVAPLIHHPDPRKVLTIGSLIQCEVARTDEMPIVSGVIQNRMRTKTPLQLDATVLYALQKWKVLGPGVVRKVQSPYNTYLHAGLPPGPICSPTPDAVRAAQKPTKTDFLYYVAKPDRRHLFSADYAIHLGNIRLARALTLAVRGGRF